MDITGDPNGEPTRLGVAFADVFTGVYSALAITAALKEREHTGKGSHIDMALLDTMVGVLANQALFYLVSGTPPERMGNAHATVVPYQTFPTTDGWMLIACGNDGQFAKMMAVLGDPGMAKDERYSTNAARVVNRDTLIPRLFELTKKLTKAELAEKFEAVGVPAGPINTLADVFADPQVIARGMRIDLPHPGGQGRQHPRRALADHHQRPQSRRRPRAAAGRRAHRRNPARDWRGMNGPHFIHRREGSPELAAEIAKIKGARGSADQHLQAAAAFADGRMTWFEHIGAIRWKTKLSPRLREIAIVRIAQVMNYAYALQQHVPASRSPMASASTNARR